MTIYKDWYIFLVVASFFLALPLRAFEFELSESTIRVGQSTFLTLRLPHSSPGTPPILFEDLLNQHKEIKLLERRTNQTSTQFEWVFEITAHKPGTFQVPPIQVQLGPNTYSTTALPLTVTTFRGEKDNQIRPEFGNLSNPFPWKKIFSFVTWGMVAGLLGWLLHRISKRVQWSRLKNWFQLPTLPSLETDKMWLKKELSLIRHSLDSKEDLSPQIVDQIVRTLRIYLKRRTHLPATGWTSREILKRLPQRYTKKDLQTVFSQADKHQFQRSHNTDTKDVAENLLKHIEREFL